VDLTKYDPFSPEVLRDPYPWYRALRADSPCHYVPNRGIWVVSRYEDVVKCARNVSVFSSTGGVSPHWEQRPMMPMYDPPKHTRLRRLVSRPFQPNAVLERSQRIERTVEGLMEKILGGGGIDLVTDVAVPLSLGVIADLIGVSEAHRADLRRWSQGVVDELAGGLDRASREQVEASRKEFVGFLRDLITQRREKGVQGDDVISLILDANEEDQLTDKETLAFCVLLLVAGYETTVNGIANGALALLENEGEWQRLTADPALVQTAVEEMIRFDGPVQSFFRNTLVDTVLHDVAIPRGGKIMLLFASANRDERKFTDPDAFRIDRSAADHIGYGVGVHYCLGAPLARAQLVGLFRALATRVRSFAISGEVVRSHNVLFRGAKSLPIVVQPK
jgi:beta-dihydromenaquinone-9 omega-hydroxylase